MVNFDLIWDAFNSLNHSYPLSCHLCLPQECCEGSNTGYSQCPGISPNCFYRAIILRVDSLESDCHATYWVTAEFIYN